ncbi:MAG: DinB family protein [Nitrolancea sp.]
MQTIDLLREQFREAHAFLEATIDGLPRASLHYSPEGNALPISGHYGHVVIGEDALLSLFLTGSPPLFASSWSGKTGYSAMPPEGGPWDDWARNLNVDLRAARLYAAAVYNHTDRLLESLSDETLARPLDMSPVGGGQRSVGYLFSLLLGNVYLHCGEISCVKGLQGLRGYPDN